MVIGNTRSGRSIRRRNSGGSTGFVPDAPPLLLVLLALGLAGCQPYTFHGTLLEPPSPAADFALTNQDGQTARLSDFRGNFVLLFFGYTHCPDVCPATLTQFKRVKADLGKDAERVMFALVTVDPERDTPERLKEYLSQFDPSFVGLTGSLADLEPVWKSYGVYREKQTGEGAAGYLMDHTARIYAVDARGNLRLTYTMDTDTNDLTQDVRYLTEEK